MRMIRKIGTYKQRAYGLLAITLFILLACFSYSYFIRAEIGYLQDKILRNESILKTIFEANMELLQAESAERGYIMTQDSLFLDNYEDAQFSFHSNLTQLGKLTAALEIRKDLYRELDSLGQARIHYLNKLIRTNDEQGETAAKELIQAGLGKHLMDLYSQKSTEMASLTIKKNNKNKAELARMLFKDLEITIAVGLIAILLILSLFVYFFRSQRKIAEYNEQLEERNKELQQFSYIASHDLKEPLRMVKNFLGLLEKKYKGRLDNKADTYIHYAVDGAKRMQLLIDDLLEYSRVGRSESQKEKVDFGTILNEVQKNLSALIAQHEAVIHIDSKLPEVSVFRLEIIRAFQNLISNAIKFHKPGIPPEIHISCVRKKSGWLFSVKDNGMGIPEQKRKEVFNVFSRLHSNENYPGTGIGLAISKKIIERHGGKIWVESQYDHGSIFYFTIEKSA